MEHIMLIYTVTGALLLFIAARILHYRLCTHPLATFPGPKFAAATFLYEFYYDIVKRGMFIWEIERMHEKYGTFLSNRMPLRKYRSNYQCVKKMH